MDFWGTLKPHRNTSLNTSFGVEHEPRERMEMHFSPKNASLLMSFPLLHTFHEVNHSRIYRSSTWPGGHSMAWWVISSMVAPVALFALGANVHDICAPFCAPEGLIDSCTKWVQCDRACADRKWLRFVLKLLGTAQNLPPHICGFTVGCQTPAVGKKQ